MITKDNFAELLRYFEFSEKNNIFKKDYPQGASIEVNFVSQRIKYYPIDEDSQESNNGF